MLTHYFIHTFGNRPYRFYQDSYHQNLPPTLQRKNPTNREAS